MIRRVSTSLLTVAALLPIISVSGQAQPMLPTRHMREAVITRRAQAIRRLPATQPMRLVFVLPHRNEPELKKLLQDIYDPSSPSFHKFLTVDEFTGRFGPSQADYDAVISFAQAHGLSVVGTSRNRMNVDVAGPVSRVEEALHVNMGEYRHPTENRTFFAPDWEPTPDLQVPLWRIAGLDNFSKPKPSLVRKPAAQAQASFSAGSCPSRSFCGSDMRAAYYGGTALTGAGQTLGLVEYYGTDLADLNTYFTNAKQTNHVPITLVSTDGTSTNCLYSQGCDDTEQTLDMTQALGMAPGLSNLVVYVGATDAAIFNAMATASPLDAQLSSSWTWDPADPTVDEPYFEEFLAQGQNLFQAAGDTARWDSTSQDYPADDPYITTVGGTDLATSGGGGAWVSESGWDAGGGGISPNKLPIPAWQTAAANGCPTCSLTYRNAPDVSANSNYTFYVCADQSICTANYYGGTSFAAPMWAAYLALANQQAVANGGSPLGFINPTLYSVGMSSSYYNNFHDITSGGNGYFASFGYDLATGWGSPNGSTLITSLVAGAASSGPPTLTSVSPSTGGPGTSVPVTLTGTNFIAGATVNISGSGVTASGVTVVSATKITATFSIDSGASLAGYSVSVTTSKGTTGTSTFTVAPPIPTLTSVTPSSGGLGANVPVTLTGTNFIAGSTINISGSGVTASGVTVVNSTQITASFNIDGGAGTGIYSVSVTTTNGTSGTVNFTVANLTPTLTSVSPSSGSPGASVPVTLTGTNFVAGATLNISGSGVTASAVTVSSATKITATLNIANGTTPGPYTLSVTTTNGTSGTVNFTVSPLIPTLTSVSPSSGAAGANVSVTLTGGNFVAGATVGISGSGVSASGVSVTSATKISATFNIDSGATPGIYTVSVTTANGTSGTVNFTVSPPTPTLTSVSPSSGAPGASVPVILTGTNFIAGATVAISGTGVTASGVSVVNNTQIAATFNITSGATVGGHNVSVTTTAGTTGTVTFTVAKPGPTLTSISPSSGTAGSLISVVLTGTNFVSPATLNFGGSGITPSSVTVVSSTQINANLTISSTATTQTVSVSTSAGTSGTVTFTVSSTSGGGGGGGASAPSITSISPAAGKAGTSVKVTITGKYLTGNPIVQVTGSAGVTVSSVTPVGTAGTSLTATFTIASTAAKGARFVSVKTSGGVSNTTTFTVQ